MLYVSVTEFLLNETSKFCVNLNVFDEDIHVEENASGCFFSEHSVVSKYEVKVK